MATTVKDVMTTGVMAAREDAGFKDIATILQRGRFSALPVVDESGVVIGVVSEADLLAKVAVEPLSRGAGRDRRYRHGVKAAALTAAELMTRPAVTIGPDATVREAAQLMEARRVKRLPVLDDFGRLIGVVSRVDLLSVFSRDDREIRDEIMHRILVGEFALDPASFEIAVSAGIVTVSGTAENLELCVLLLDAIRHVEGVVSVRDRLTVAENDVVDAETEPAAP